MSDPDQPAKSALPTIVILGIVALSVILFFAFTLPYFKNRGAQAGGDRPPGEDTSAAAPAPAPVVDPSAPANTGSPSTASPVAGSTPAGAGTASAKVYANPEQLAGELAQALKAGNLEAARAIVGSGALDPNTAERFETLMIQGSYRIDDENPFVEIGRIDSKIRYGFHFARPDGGGLVADEKRILVDIDRKDGAQGWLVTDIHIPTFSALSLAAVAATGPGDAAASGASGASAAANLPAPIVIEASSAGPKDPLMLAHEFVEAILNQDFAKAKSLVDNDLVTEEKLAGLLIVAEEGGFQRKANAPLVATATKGDAAWVIAQMTNAETGADFGLEIVKAADGSGDWKIAALNLDSLLLARSKMADADDVTYAPIIKNPRGGDSLVLYFGYDESGLHPRAERQIAIVAAILKSDPKKTIMVGGHADAKGPDDYNEALSDQRAAAVRAGLLSAGVRPSQIVTRSFGESEPISPNLQPDGSDNPTGRKRNRRAEVYLNF